MRRKNITSEMMKSYIMESLLSLMEQKAYSEITIGEITEKAGVNRSTYYRNFDSKEDIIRYFFIGIMDEYLISVSRNMSMEEYLTGMFRAFYKKRKQIMTIYHSNTAYILFDTLNGYFADHTVPDKNSSTFEDLFSLYYHTGGIFNSLLLWFANNMKPSPEELAKLAVKTNPPDFRPLLLK